MNSEKYQPEQIIIFGGGGHAKSMIDLLRLEDKFQIMGILDDHLPAGSAVMHVPVLGGSELLDDLHKRGLQFAVNAIGGIGQPDIRQEVFDRLKQAGYEFPACIHPRAFVESTAQIEPGVQVLAMAYVGSESRIGFGSILNYGSIVSHDCLLGNCVNLSPGGTLAGNVEIGSYTQIGMQATVNLGVKIGSHVQIGNGATIKKDIADGLRIHAGAVWPPPVLQDNEIEG